MMTSGSRPNIALAMAPALTPDLMGPEQWQRLAAITNAIDCRPLESFAGPDATYVLERADILLTGWGCPRVDEDVLGRAPHLRLVAHTGSSVRPIVSDALWARDIQVVSAAAANAIAVAEFALAAILLANKGAFTVREDYRARRIPPRHPWVAPGEKGNYRAVVGIVGASRTGRHLLKLLAGFDLTVLVYDPVVPPSEIEALGGKSVPLDDLMAAADAVSINAPSLPKTRGMIDGKRLARLRDGATLINTARGDIVERHALERELISGRISAVLDVTDPEPLQKDSVLFDLPNVFITPHMAGAAGHETRRLADLAIDEIERFGRGQPLRHQVTRERLSTLG